MGASWDCLVRGERHHHRCEHPELALPDDYPHLLAALKAQIRSAQWTAVRVVNTALIELYWGIGKAILDRQKAEGWGAKVIDQLAVDLSLAFPDSKGFSRRNLHYMRRLAEAWPAPAFVQQPAAQMPWGHLMVVLDKLDEPAARDWYVRQSLAGGWSRNVLLNQIKGQAHARAGAAPSNFELTLPGEDSELAVQIAKDPYVFDFLGLSGRVAERDLERALVARLRDTLLELGTGFSFVGQQVHLDVGGDDFYIDLLFFNIPQVRYVVVELKMGKFEPEFAGKLGFYIAAVDDRLRDPALHAPTVGILMCTDRNDTVVRYALSGAAQPMAVAGYTYDALPPAERAALPSDTRVAAALQAPVDVDGRQMTVAEYLESVGAEPWTGPGDANN
ncbi:MAG TPA: PDDEXK nuclease domain-containing protein [Nocardioidaceae bacterium]|nr:PDDEXK nuclease domain-containing protein [Nocardioidaceae bacterium]